MAATAAIYARFYAPQRELGLIMAKKPSKPYASYPLYAHAGGVWAKKIRGKVHYFGPWSDPQGALESFLEKRDYLYAGVELPSEINTVGDLIDAFLDEKQTHLATGDLSQATYREYEATCEVIRTFFGSHRPTDSLSPSDFRRLRIALAVEKCKCQSSVSLASLRKRLTVAELREIRDSLKEGKTRIKSTVGTITVVEPVALTKILKQAKVYAKAFDRLQVTVDRGRCECNSELSIATKKRRFGIARMLFADQRRDCRRALKAPPQRLLRERARERGKLLYSADDIRKLVNTADPYLKAMILLGINCGFGPKDCCTLPASEIEDGWHNFARPKTGVERRCPLWPETMAAIEAVRGTRLVFNGRVWDRYIVAEKFTALCEACDVTNHGFYSLRRTFETIATTASVSQAAIDHIMGHARNDMASVYRQQIFDQQLQECANHVRDWFLGTLTLA